MSGMAEVSQLGPCVEGAECFHPVDVPHRRKAGVAIRIGLWSGGSGTGVSADISFAHHGPLFLGELTRREARDHNLPCPTNK